MLDEIDLEGLFLAEQLAPEEMRSAFRGAHWTRDYMNSLPDGSFLFIERGGRIDHEGKTTPRRLRHIAVRDHLGKVHAPHVCSAGWKIDRDGQISKEKGKELHLALDSLRKEHTIEEIVIPATVKTEGEADMGEQLFYLTDLPEKNALTAEVEWELFDTAEGKLFQDKRFDRYRQREDFLFFSCRMAVGDSFDREERRILSADLEKGQASVVACPVNFRHRRQQPIGTVVAHELVDNQLFASGVLWTGVFPEVAWMRDHKLELSVSWELFAQKEPVDSGFNLRDIRFVGLAICPREAAAVPEAELLEFAATEEEAMDKMTEKLLAEHDLVKSLEVKLEEAQKVHAALTSDKTGVEAKLAEATAKIEELEEGRDAAITEALAAEKTKAETIDTRSKELEGIFAEVVLPEDKSELLDDAKFGVFKAEAERDKARAELKAAQADSGDLPSGGTPPEQAATDQKGLGDFQVHRTPKA